MRRAWIVAAVAALGLVIVFLAFPQPDTGATPEQADTPPIAGLRHRPAGVGQPAVQRDRMPIQGNTPIAREQLQILQQPDSLYAGRLAGPLALARRTLSAHPEADAQQLAKQVDGLLGRLRTQRKDPTTYVLSELIAEGRTWFLTLQASPFGSEPDVRTQAGRFEQISAEYEARKAQPHSPDAPAAAEPAPGD